MHISDDKKQFWVNDSTKRRVYSRHELLKVEGVEGRLQGGESCLHPILPISLNHLRMECHKCWKRWPLPGPSWPARAPRRPVIIKDFASCGPARRHLLMGLLVQRHEVPRSRQQTWGGAKSHGQKVASHECKFAAIWTILSRQRDLPKNGQVEKSRRRRLERVICQHVCSWGTPKTDNFSKKFQERGGGGGGAFPIQKIMLRFLR